MAHECPDCGQACYCDQDDTWLDPPADGCECVCYLEDDDGYDGDDDDCGEPTREELARAFEAMNSRNKEPKK